MFCNHSVTHCVFLDCIPLGSRKFRDLYVWTKFPNKIVSRRYVLWLSLVINLHNLSIFGCVFVTQ